jgi:hypothetical protein
MNLILLQGTGPVPLSGYLICFVPLATIVLGLVAFFVFTDRHASRPYLRFNPFVAATKTSAEIAARPPAVGETPAGPLGAPAGKTTITGGQLGQTVAVPKADVPPPAADPAAKPAFSGEPPANIASDFGRVTGVDLPKVDQRANTGSPDLPVSKALDITYIEFDPPGSDLEGEYVRIQNNTGRAINLTGWTLHDGADKHVFTFPAFSLATGAEVRIWSKAGTNDAANLYWGSRSPIWNNTGDTARLLDASGKEISRYSYIGK